MLAIIRKISIQVCLLVALLIKYSGIEALDLSFQLQVPISNPKAPAAQWGYEAWKRIFDLRHSRQNSESSHQLKNVTHIHGRSYFPTGNTKKKWTYWRIKNFFHSQINKIQTPIDIGFTGRN